MAERRLLVPPPPLQSNHAAVAFYSLSQAGEKIAQQVKNSLRELTVSFSRERRGAGPQAGTDPRNMFSAFVHVQKCQLVPLAV